METAYNHLGRGAGIVVRFGARGSQYAIVAGLNRAGNLVAHKWRAQSGKWTKRVVIEPGEIIRRATLGEFKTTTPVSTAPGWR